MYKHDSKSPDSPMTPNTLVHRHDWQATFFSGFDVSGLDWSPSLALRNQNNAISYRHIESISVLKF